MAVRGASRWPPELLDARALPTTHDWALRQRRDLGTSHAAVRAGARDRRLFGAQRLRGDLGQSARLRSLGRAWQLPDGRPTSCCRSSAPVPSACACVVMRDDEITPFHAACLQAAAGAGIPAVDDLNDLDQDVGIATSPVNIVDGVRWNAAFAYLDPVRERAATCTIVGDVLVDRLIVRGERVEAISRAARRRRVTVRAGRVVLCGGAYGSPAILLRSGIGEPAELQALGIAPAVDLPGVGRNLHDHPVGGLIFTGTPELERRMTRVRRRALAARGADHRQGALDALQARIRSAHLSDRRTEIPRAAGAGSCRSPA